MNTTLQLNVPVTFKQLAELAKKLPKKEQLRLVSILQKPDIEDDEPSKQQILDDLKETLIQLKNGTLKTRPLSEVLNEL